ncbi:MAG: acyltransferase [Bacteroidaceae bacterium]|nr:acyltransferase [Bacteroidaceae bacterium]
MQTKHLDDISILRVFCILVVVFFHCYGMMYAEAHFPETISEYKKLYFIPVQCVFINIAMPMFVFISGYLFEFLLQKGKYPTWGNLLQKKGIRILLPYFVFGLFFMATTRNWKPFILLNGGYWHLWFLPMLFWCFILGYAIYKMQLRLWAKLVLVIITFIFSLIPKFIPTWLGLHNITVWFYWFYLGMLIYKYRDSLYSYVRKYKLSLPLLLSSISIIVFLPVEYGDNTWFGNLAVTICIISISYLMNNADWSKHKFTSKIDKFSSYSFGIYIWHNWVAMMLISKTSQNIFGLPTLVTNHVILFPLCFSLITLAISWVLSWGMMKTKIGRFLIG